MYLTSQITGVPSRHEFLLNFPVMCYDLTTMKRKLGFLFFILAFFALVVGGIKLLGGRAPAQGELKIDSNNPAGIFLGTTHLGQTPYEDKANSGEYTLKLVPDSTAAPISSWQGNIQVAPGLLTYVNADLGDSDFTTAVDVLSLEKVTSKVSEIAVTTNPDGATVALDGETRGVTPVSLAQVAAGDHTLAVSSPGFITRTIRLKTTVGYRLNADIKLALSPEGGMASPSAQTTLPAPTGGTSATSSSSTNPAKPYAVIKDTPTGFLRVRMEPSTNATEAARVNPGDKFPILDTQDGWYKISYDGTNDGWISAQYADKVE